MQNLSNNFELANIENFHGVSYRIKFEKKSGG